MRITFIGAGRVAYHLAKVLHPDHQIVQVFSRDLEKANRLASLVDAVAISDFEQLSSDIDLVIIAISDQAIAEVIQKISAYLQQVLIVHTSGSTSLEVLSVVNDKSGVFYPLQTFSYEREIDWTTTPVFVEAVNNHDLDLLTSLAGSLTQKVYQYSSQQRQTLHMAAVFACNFSNYCYDIAKQIVDEQQVDFSLLHPLILETAQKATINDPKEMQTGPAMRGDENILKMHHKLLEKDARNDLVDVYQLLSEGIKTRHLPGK
ncbi:MAG: F420-dependent NADP oxidoreductase [Acinetobacter sp. GWC1_38_13]|jgi:predicted short-subunit dehydrogenase-like oxidoreductase (DUF2520 family)|uniref:DUF2520 domain-containing protein n=1 Tax=Acinetobacter junii TaxID=40215 RepID=A0A365PKY5_ACIJU|nr:MULTISPECIES: Rossmann-like and DUF2520 domain-containing protein [Acinetobacter]OFW43316.1 MAG: F420-dependent NADP oxidoreductase [Acinetobacter sp. GWC1_38_13]RBA30406.1 DUF2520 domain-containing protein [Acinetobacter junii]RBA41200.1 DUF2520 domain-containing protein [Acinetobacter junii]RBA49063.1 DUF2520 domain-containing protein [Acinetobacter junii]RSE32582.1 DUF2520 domain-containing protein [Acinetobacter junii]